ncbi:hypothetical protein EVAR_79804_1 [Eumeta japonica]|uniref:Uncharacterized protein n=1 Tax=Eumeta variegata TaxID=151549 RepID=A0A4C1WRW7_EUMVA|nr:hypothetical protein EVAR_79804_1 [Eumeta japonica]
MRYFFGKNTLKKTPEELERADERKRRLQRERSRRYRALKNARRQNESGRESESEGVRVKCRPAVDEEASDGDEPPTLCGISYDDKWRDGEGAVASDCASASDDNSTHASELKDPPARELAVGLRELLSAPNADLDYPTVHSLMLHWLQT